jgi:hypothetical protein
MTVSSRTTIALASLPLVLAVCGSVMSLFAVDPAAPDAVDNAVPVSFDSTVPASDTAVRDAFLRMPIRDSAPATPPSSRPALTDL